MDTQDLKYQVKLEDYIGRFVQLQKRGDKFVGLCPFHNEKTPSFSVVASKQFYNCFGCGAAGDIYKFIMEFFSVDFKTAKDDLQSYLGGGVARQAQGDRVKNVVKEDETVFECMTADEKYLYDEQLGRLMDDGKDRVSSHPDALKDVMFYRFESNREVFEELYYYCFKLGWTKEAYDYLTVTRKISPYNVDRFKLFCIKDYYRVNNHLKKKFPIEQLQKSGLYNVKEDGTGNLIFFHHGIVMPYLYGKYAQILYMRARWFWEGSADCGDENKYFALRNDALNVNTPKRFFNSDILSGLIPGEKLIICEGEFDAVIWVQLGKNAIAIPGTGNIPHLKKFKPLKSFNIAVSVDNDTAGSKLLTGEYYYKGEKRYSEKNLMHYLREIGQNTITRLKLPAKDINELVMKEAKGVLR